MWPCIPLLLPAVIFLYLDPCLQVHVNWSSVEVDDNISFVMSCMILTGAQSLEEWLPSWGLILLHDVSVRSVVILSLGLLHTDAELKRRAPVKKTCV